MRFVGLALIAGGVLASACSGTMSHTLGPSPSTSPTSEPPSFDPQTQEIAVQFPGFAGLVDDASTNTLQVRLTREAPDIDMLESAIFARFPDLKGRRIEVVDISQIYGRLREWQTQIEAVLDSRPGLVNEIVSTGLDSSGDVINIGVLTEDAQQLAYREITAMGIPLDAVNVFITGPFVPD